MFPFWARLPSGSTEAFQVPGDAKLCAMYKVIKAEVGHQVSITFRGQRLPNDDELVSDAGLSAECTVEVLSANDFTILDDFIKRDKRIWNQLMDGINSYESFEDQAAQRGMSVMAFAAQTIKKSIIYVEGDHIRFVHLDFEGINVSLNCAALSRLTKLQSVPSDWQHRH